MIPDDHVWVFLGDVADTPSGIFRKRELAETWIAIHGLSGTLSALPVDEGVFDWAFRHDAITMKAEKLERKKNDPNFIASCYPASLDHYHYIDGRRFGRLE